MNARSLVVAALAAWALCVPAHAGVLEVVADGRNRGTVSDYRVGPEVYLGAKDIGALYGAQVHWYPVSGRLRLTLRGRALDLMVGAETAVLDGARIPLGGQVILRGSEAFVPSGLLKSREFRSWSGASTEIDDEKRVLLVDRVSSTGPVRWFSHDAYTRIVLELDDGLSYRAAARGVAGLEIVLPAGFSAAPGLQSVADGRVESLAVEQGSGGTRLAVKLAAEGLGWKVQEMENPRRLVLDVFRKGDEALAGAARPSARPMAAPPGAPAAPAVAEAAPSASSAAATAAPVAVPQPADGSAAAPAAGPAVPAAAVPRSGKLRVVIDAGHGGKDSGAIGRKGTKEKDVVLAVALALARRLEDDDRFEVLLTRADDYFVPLAERSVAANGFAADLFVSIHCNASPKKRDEGFEIYFLSEKASDPEAQRIADYENSVLELEGKSVEEEEAAIILRAMTKVEYMNEGARFAATLSRAVAKTTGVEDRGVKQAAFYVLRGTDAPAVLYEIAFLSHRKDEAKLASKSFRKKVVEGLYRGIVDYEKEPRGTARAAAQPAQADHE